MKTLLICLEMDGRVLHEVRSDSFSGPIGIGRSRDCAWSVSGVDPSMSAHHAEIFAKGRALWLRDGAAARGDLTKAGAMAIFPPPLQPRGRVAEWQTRQT